MKFYIFVFALFFFVNVSAASTVDSTSESDRFSDCPGPNCKMKSGAPSAPDVPDIREVEKAKQKVKDQKVLPKEKEKATANVEKGNDSEESEDSKSNVIKRKNKSKQSSSNSDATITYFNTTPAKAPPCGASTFMAACR